MNHCDHISMYVNIASMYIRRNLDALFSEQGCSSGVQGRLLSMLAHSEEKGQPVYQKDVEKAFGIRRSSVNSLISSLEAHGYVERIQEKDDARCKRLKLTDQGHQQHQQIHQAIDSFENALSSEFTPEEQQLIISMMKRIIDHYEEEAKNNRKEPIHD